MRVKSFHSLFWMLLIIFTRAVMMYQKLRYIIASDMLTSSQVRSSPRIPKQKVLLRLHYFRNCANGGNSYNRLMKMSIQI